MLWIIVYIIYACHDSVRGFTSCKEGNFLHEGVCAQCSPTCLRCTSLDNCTACKDSFYGPTCSGSCAPCMKCHKLYGYCTFACPDGQFGSNDSVICSPCPAYCQLCISVTSCVECKPGYDVAFCKACPDTCEECNKTTSMCLRCKSGYFNKKGSCHRCADGCNICEDLGSCSMCQDGYLGPYDGQCIEECPNGTMTRQLISEMGQRCGMPTPSTCRKISSLQPYTCLTKRHCVQLCSSENDCPMSNENGNRNCDSMLMFRKCILECKPPVNLEDKDSEETEHMCSEECLIKELEDSSNHSRCLYGNKLTSGNDKTITEGTQTVLCFQDRVKDTSSQPGTNRHVTLIITALIVIVVVIIAVLCWYKLRKIKITRSNSTGDQLSEKQREHSTAEIQVPMTSFMGRHSDVHNDGHSSVDSSTSSNIQGVIRGHLPQGEYMALGTRLDGSIYESIQQSDVCMTDEGSLEASGVSVSYDIVKQPTGVSVIHADVQEPSGVSVIHADVQQPSGVSVIHDDVQQPSGVSVIHDDVQQPSVVSVIHADVQQPSGVSVIHDDVQQPSGVSVICDDAARETSMVFATQLSTTNYVNCENTTENCENIYLTLQ